MATYAPYPTTKREPSGDQETDQGISRLKVKFERATQNTTEIFDYRGSHRLSKTHPPMSLPFCLSQIVSPSSSQFHLRLRSQGESFRNSHWERTRLRSPSMAHVVCRCVC